MKTYTAHNKMAASLRKAHQTILHALPATITTVKICKAQADESKRRLVRAALFANTELHRRNPMPYTEPTNQTEETTNVQSTQVEQE